MLSHPADAPLFPTALPLPAQRTDCARCRRRPTCPRIGSSTMKRSLVLFVAAACGLLRIPPRRPKWRSRRPSPPLLNRIPTTTWPRSQPSPSDQLSPHPLMAKCRRRSSAGGGRRRCDTSCVGLFGHCWTVRTDRPFLLALRLQAVRPGRSLQAVEALLRRQPVVGERLAGSELRLEPVQPGDRFNGPVTWTDRANEYQMNEFWYGFGRVDQDRRLRLGLGHAGRCVLRHELPLGHVGRLRDPLGQRPFYGMRGSASCMPKWPTTTGP